MELQKVLGQLEGFSLEPYCQSSDPSYIQTHKMIKPGQQQFFESCLYVGHISELPSPLSYQGKAHLICIRDAPFPDGFSTGDDVDLYTAPEGTNQFDILNRIADILIDEARLITAMRRILDVLYGNAGLQALVDTASEVFENPVFVNDTAFKILAMPYSMVFKNETLEQEKKLGYVHIDNVEALRRDGFLIEKTNKSHRIVESMRHSTNETWLFRSVRVQGVAVADIALVNANRPLRQIDYELLERFAQIVAIEMEKVSFYTENRGDMFSFFLNDLLNNKFPNPKTIAQRAQILRMDMRTWTQILLIADPNEAISGERAHRIGEEVRTFIPNCRWTAYQRNLIAFVTNDQRPVIGDTAQERLAAFLDQNSLIAGLSVPYQALEGSPKYYRQALHAMEAGSFAARSFGFFEYEASIPFYLAEIVMKHGCIEDFRPEYIVKLIDYDERNDTELLCTLDTHLRHVGDPVAAAQELFIHRNTLLYRIHKIEELTGIDLSDGDERLNIQLYLKFAQYQRGGWMSSSR